MMKRISIALLLALLSSVAYAQNPGLIYSGTSPAANDCVKFINRSLVTTTGAACSTGTSFAIPTVSVGLTTNAGVLTTALRSDARLALDQTAAFAFSGLGATNLLTGSALSWNSDFFITRAAAAKGYFGAAPVDTGPVNQTLQAQSVITGSGTSNVAGATLTIQSGQGKGNATGSSLIFQTPVAVASGTGAQTMTTALTLDGTQAAIGNSFQVKNVAFNSAVTGISGTAPFMTSVDGNAVVAAVYMGYGNTASAAQFQFYKTRSASTDASVSVNSGDTLGGFSARGAAGGAYAPAGRINILADGTPSGSSMPGRIELAVTPSGTIATVVGFRLDNAQNAYVSSTGSLGFNSAAFGSGAQDVFLTRGGAATLQHGAATGSGAAVAQTLQVQGSSGNSAAAALFTIAGSDQSGTTTTGGGLKIRGGNGTSAGGTVEIWTSATTTPTLRWQTTAAGHLLAGTDNAYDIGAVGATRPRNIYGAGTLTVGGIASFGGAVTTTSDFNAGSARYIGFSSRSYISSASDGVLLLSNNGVSDFGRLQFGGTTSSFPALKRSSTVLQARLADDSDFAPLQGKLTTDAAAVTGLVAGALAALTNSSLVIYDSTGTAYRIPAITP